MISIPLEIFPRETSASTSFIIKISQDAYFVSFTSFLTRLVYAA